MDRVENLECLYQGYGILEEKWVTDSQCHSVLGSMCQEKVSMYAKYDPNPSTLSQDFERKPIWGMNQGPPYSAEVIEIYVQTICTSSDHGLIICEVSKLLA